MADSANETVPPHWAHLFPEGDFEWAFRMRQGDPVRFFCRSDPDGGLLREKSELLADSPGRHLAFLPEAERHLPELHRQFTEWGVAVSEDAHDIKTLSCQLEPDFLLMEQESQKLIAASVCFPSSWEPARWIGEPLTAIHDVVPNLNPQIGSMIEKFLRQLKPGRAAQRANWSLTWGDELNYHPDLQRPAIDESTPIDEVYLRLEHQIFAALPQVILMGIRIEPVPLDSLAVHRVLWQQILQKLETMPPEVARYKNLHRGLASIVEKMKRWREA